MSKMEHEMYPDVGSWEELLALHGLEYEAHRA